MRPLYTMELYSDTYYIRRVQMGDTACFACLLDKYSKPIHSLIMKIVQNNEEAEELAQDVFLKVFKNLSSFKEESRFSTWIYRIAYNTAISQVRKKKMEYLAIDEKMINNVSEEDINDVLGGAEQAVMVNRLELALQQLEPEERGIILLFYMKQKSIEEIKEITGFSVSNIKVKLHRIRKKLFVLINKIEDE